MLQQSAGQFYVHIIVSLVYTKNILYILKRNLNLVCFVSTQNLLFYKLLSVISPGRREFGQQTTDWIPWLPQVWGAL